MKATKKQMREEIAALRSIGAQMSNLCFNLAQGNKTLEPHDREIMDALRQQWDLIPRSEK